MLQPISTFVDIITSTIGFDWFPPSTHTFVDILEPSHPIELEWESMDYNELLHMYLK